MKNWLGTLTSGIIGGVLVFVLMTTLKVDAPVSHELHAPAMNVNSASTFAFDFSEAAELATKAVVHIKAAESESLARQRMEESKRKNPFGNSPFGGLFGDDFFNYRFFEPYPKMGSGSGVIISSDGYIVTNNHVVGFADDIVVTLSNEKSYKGKVVGTDPNSDLAVVKIEADNLPVLEFADSDNAKVGEWVLAVGNPFDYLTSTVTAGIISAKGRDINIIKEYKAIEEFIQTDAAINPGNSGGALVDANGRLLGINTAIASRTGYYNGYSFAIPVNLMTQIVDDIIKYGSYQRANLGVYINDLDDEIRSTLDVDIMGGVVVTELVEGGAAQYAGIRPNDIITSVDSKNISNAEDLVNKVSLARVGDTLNLEILRDGKKKKIPVRLRKGL